MHGSAMRRGKSWGLLILGILSVLAPVWANVYVCPMERAREKILPACCAKAEAPVTQAGTRFAPPCDCPRLVWQAGETDLVRAFQIGSVDMAPIPAVLPWVRESWKAPASVPPDSRERGASLPPPLWMRNLSIRC